MSKQGLLETHDEHKFRKWMDAHVQQLLNGVGIGGGRTVLDFGCGEGKFALEAARIVGPKGKVYALDIHSSKLKTVRDKARSSGLKNLKTILNKGASVATKLPTKSIDVVLLYDVIQLVEEKRELVRELFRVLKPDGFLSVFPMHFGKEKMLELLEEEKLFRVRDDYGVILNLVSKTSDRGRVRSPKD